MKPSVKLLKACCLFLCSLRDIFTKKYHIDLFNENVEAFLTPCLLTLVNDCLDRWTCPRVQCTGAFWSDKKLMTHKGANAGSLDQSPVP